MLGCTLDEKAPNRKRTFDIDALTLTKFSTLYYFRFSDIFLVSGGSEVDEKERRTKESEKCTD